jgi:hypothetical protein
MHKVAQRIITHVHTSLRRLLRLLLLLSLAFGLTQRIEDFALALGFALFGRALGPFALGGCFLLRLSLCTCLGLRLSQSLCLRLSLRLGLSLSLGLRRRGGSGSRLCLSLRLASALGCGCVFRGAALLLRLAFGGCQAPTAFDAVASDGETKG